MTRQDITARPLYELKRLGNRVRLAVEELCQRRGIEFMGGPQGQVVHYLDEHADEECTIKDIERELDISKSVASNLVRRMEKNNFVEVEPSKKDKRSKVVRLSENSLNKMTIIHDFFRELDDRLVAGISSQELAVFGKVLKQFEKNIEEMKEGERSNEEIDQKTDR